MKLEYQGKAGVAHIAHNLKEEGKQKEFNRREKAADNKTNRNSSRLQTFFGNFDPMNQYPPMVQHKAASLYDGRRRNRYSHSRSRSRSRSPSKKKKKKHKKFKKEKRKAKNKYYRDDFSSIDSNDDYYNRRSKKKTVYLSPPETTNILESDSEGMKKLSSDDNVLNDDHLQQLSQNTNET